jgi:hypothetical protein
MAKRLKEPKIKSLYRGAFNYAHAVEIEYAYAYTANQAKAVICRRLAKKHGVGFLTVWQLFDGSRDNFEITIELEVREDE